MFFERIRRCAGFAGLGAAIAFAAPAGSAFAATHGSPTPMTVTPDFAARVAAPLTEAETGADAIEVAQNRNRQIRRLRRQNRRLRNQRNRARANNRRWQRRHYHRGRWYYDYGGGRWYDDSGAAVAAGVIGLAGAAIIGSAIANQGPRTVVVEDPRGGYPAPYTAAWYRDCDLKYRSFRASDGTYLGYDGNRHVCRLP